MKMKVVRDEDPMSPMEWDNLGTILCMHRKYDLGDRHSLRQCDFEGWAAVEQYLHEELDAFEVLPIYMLDHSGITISTTPFADPWDSGQVGFIYTTAARIEELGCTDVLAELAREVSVYDQWLRGDVYGYVIEDDHGNLIISCFGIFGEEAAQEEGEEALRWHLEHAPKPCVQQVTMCTRSADG
jgi:hypothetical protein